MGIFFIEVFIDVKLLEAPTGSNNKFIVLKKPSLDSLSLEASYTPKM